ncbi:energy-coupling factor ABC transporter ATP-binding protein [Anaerocolumna sp. MB42-C2]|uniref:energy-coupling factor ABC transporter ATP-binding protein n=1 Tax=Anaerocolumna sp. MB42-C2 TaxID=3070997 RepID=UPI0027E10F9F|nr:ATP-binding cassette domain-containing protein [Anaerocolumna sp. MB42-C2]WMJ90328.1 ATP-binding cassette domain-containing protein [Anaerocolumna sp. MB42-C2]
MNAVEITDLCWKYDGAKDYIFEHLNLIIRENIFMGIVGSNESGKTTLVSCIKGIIPNSMTGIYKGKVTLFGEHVKDCDSRVISESAGMVFSDPDAQFTTMSVEEEIAFGLENIGIPVEVIEERIKWVSEICHLEDLLEKPPFDLSGGQKQRVAIASVLAAKPKMIILDEPTSMLDPKSKDEVFEILEIIKKTLNMTVVVIEHNIEKIAELSDEVVLMKDGKIVRHMETRDFFKDVALLKDNSLKVPEGIELMYYLYDKFGINKTGPVKLEEITEEIKGLLAERKVG